jgi:NADH-quinone oxidoreductase subunit J
MTLAFFLNALVIVASAVAAVSLRNLVHCALALAVTFIGLAALFLQLGAQFIAFAQILVYVGAVAVLIVFAILLTRSGETRKEPVFSVSWIVGLGVALLMFSALAAALLASPALARDAVPAPAATTRAIGEKLMTTYALPLQVIGLLLTAAMLGAVIIALREKPEKADGGDSGSR